MQNSIKEKSVSPADTSEWLQNSLGMSILDLMPQNLIKAKRAVVDMNKNSEKKIDFYKKVY